MSKRFTDTNKWDKAWFRKLKPKMKCVWSFLCDKCDHAGIWEIDEESLTYFVGEKISMKEVLTVFGEKIEYRENDKLLIRSFIDFQYGELNPDNRVHKSVLEKISKLAPYKPLISPLEGAKDKDKDKDKELDKDKNKDKAIENENMFIQFVEYWNSFVELPKIIKLTKERKEKLKTRFLEQTFDYKIAIPMILESDFLMGKSGNWRADIDWFISNETNILKILEGKYTNGTKKDPVNHAKAQMQRLLKDSHE